MAYSLAPQVDTREQVVSRGRGPCTTNEAALYEGMFIVVQVVEDRLREFLRKLIHVGSVWIE
jgi:hypothetical protein